MIMPQPTDPNSAALAALQWQIEAGADEAIGETALDRFTLSAAQEKRAAEAEAARKAQAASASAPLIPRSPSRLGGRSDSLSESIS